MPKHIYFKKQITMDVNYKIDKIQQNMVKALVVVLLLNKFAFFNPSQNLRRVVRNDDISASASHSTHYLNEYIMQIERIRLSTVVNHRVFTRHLINAQWVVRKILLKLFHDVQISHTRLYH